MVRLGDVEVVFDEPSAGQVSLHSDLLLHGKEANVQIRRRCGLTLRYCTPDVVAGSNWHHKDVVVAGNDVSGNRANPARPASEDSNDYCVQKVTNTNFMALAWSALTFCRIVDPEPSIPGPF